MDRDVEDALRDVQAQLYAQRVALRALARTHPDADALLAAWRDALTEARTSNPVAPADSRGSLTLAEQTRAYADEWTAELVDLAITSPDDIDGKGRSFGPVDRRH